MIRRNRYLLILVAIIVTVVAIRAALPVVVKDYINGKLAVLESYRGSVADIDLALWRGAYRIDGIRIVKRDGTEETPFFDGDRVDLSVEWRSLLKGSVVAEAKFIRPRLNLVQSSNESEEQLGNEVNWAERLGELFPIRFNTVTVEDGTVTFRTPGIRTNDALVARSISGTVSNLTNVVDRNKETFADFAIQASVLEDGFAEASGSINPLAPTPTFDVNLAVRKVQLPQVNPWLREYLKADAASGDFELYMEVAAADGRFKGYAKPLMRNVDMHGAEDRNEPLLRRMWEGLVDFGAKVFENDDKEQVAARVPFGGSIENPQAGIFETIVSVLRNAFVGAFANSLEGSISLRSVKKELGRYDVAEGAAEKESTKQPGEKSGKDERKDKRSESRVDHGPRAAL